MHVIVKQFCLLYTSSTSEIHVLPFVHYYRFEKRVRYASRKARADVRKRVKGRFVKAGDAYDYDPLNQTRSC